MISLLNLAGCAAGKQMICKNQAAVNNPLLKYDSSDSLAFSFSMY